MGTEARPAQAATGSVFLPSCVREVGQGFYNIRGSLKAFGGWVDVGTHMSLLRLESGRFLVVDTIAVSEEVKAFLDSLTDKGALIEAVIATHPYHTLFFPAFHALYPNAQYYGTPRHLRVQTQLPWAGCVKDVMSKWEPDVLMRIPAGADFDTPAENNHFSSVFVLHAASRTIHDDDTIMCVENPGHALWLFGFRAGGMYFHTSLKGVGLYQTPEGPLDFMRWVEELIRDWDFDSICTAHTGNQIGGAKAKLQKLLEDTRPALQRMSDKRRAKAGGSR